MNSSSQIASLDFYASKNCQLAKNRRNFLIFGGLGAAIAVIPVIHNHGLIGTMIAIFVVTFGLIDYAMRRQLRSGNPIVTLTDESICSPNLSSKSKQIFWKDIESSRIMSIQGHQFIEFVLRESAGIRNRRSFWTGINHAKPRLPLSTFSAEDQEKLFSEILHRHIRSCSPDQLELLKGPLTELRENREFEERLKSLQPNTWVTYGLIALNVLIWGVTLTQGAEFTQSPADKLLLWGGNAASEIQKGEWWRLLTATFLHSGFVHIFMNMVGLYSVGVSVERIYGKQLYSLIYLVSGVMGSVLSLHFSAQNVVSVGASGAVFGVTGAMLVAVAQNRDKLPKIFSQQTLSGMGIFIVYSLVQGFSKQGIDNAAHIGGLAGGCLAAWILPERFDLEKYKRVFFSRAVLTTFVMSSLIIGGVNLAPRATIDQGRIIASQEIVKRGLQKFDNGIRELQREVEAIKSGKISEQEGDFRGRTVIAPVFQDIAAELSQVVLHPNDPRTQFVQDIKRMSELLAEQLAMESVFNEDSQKYEPVDPLRAEKIEAELKPVSDRIVAFIQKVKTKKQ